MTHSIYRRLARRFGARRSHRVLAAALASSLWLAAACDDVPAPSDPVARPLAAQPQSRGPIYDPNFDSYSAKVVVTMSGGGIAKLPPLPERRLEYGIERTLAQGIWNTTYDFGSVREAGTLRRIPIRKVVAGADGMQYFDHNGHLIPLGSRLPVGVNGSDFPAPPDARPPAPAATRGDPRAWVGNLVTSPAAGAKRRAQLEQSFVRAGSRGNTVRFRRQRDDLVVEIVLDTTRGTIEETRTSLRGRNTASTTFEYQNIGGDQWLRVRAVHRQNDPGTDRHPVTVEQVLADQRFLRTEGR